MKECDRCKIVKDYSCFCSAWNSEDGYWITCYDCIKDCERILKENYREYLKRHPRDRKAEHKKRFLNPRNVMYTRMSNSIRRSLNDTASNWENMVGYTVEDLMKHLESLFEVGMTWENREEWHIDHIIPLAYFNYTSPEDEDFKKCWALENLQPLWAYDNKSKNNKIDWVKK